MKEPHKDTCEALIDSRLSFIAEGMHAIIVGSGMPGTILKITRCSESIELLRRLKNAPVAGLPEVLNEIHTEDISLIIKERFKGKEAACFELVKYQKIEQSFREFDLVQECLTRYAREPSIDNNPIKILVDGSLQLKLEGFYRFANAIEFLIDFLAARPKAFLDACSANFMIDAQHNLIYVDPVSHQN
ncbi:MAG: hypothetical protein Q8P42_04875 [Gallionella sp.]|nr:hypothetical protein [Gallionella sp.]